MKKNKKRIRRTFKSALLGASALIAVSSSLAFAAEQVDNLNDASTTALTVGNSAKWEAPAAGLDEIFTVADGVNVGDTGVVVSATTANGVGTLKFLGDSTATGTVGASGQAVGKIDLNGTGKTVAITADVFASAIEFTGTTTLNAGGDINGAVDFSNTAGVLSLAADQKIVGTVDSTGGTAGTLTFAATTVDTTMVSGNVGATNALTAVNVNAGAATTATFGGTVAATTITSSGTGTVAFSGDVTGNVNMSADGTITVAADKKIVGDVDNTTGGDGAGTLTFAATTANTTLVSGDVGDTNSLKAVNVNAGAATTATFGGTIDATTVTTTGTGTVAFSDDVTGAVNMASDGTISVAANKKIVGAVDNTTGGDGAGTLTFAEATSSTTVVSGNVGATNTLKAVNVTAGSSATATLGGTVAATTVTTAGAGNTTITGDVTATTITAGQTGTLAFSGDATGNVNMSADGTTTVAATKKIVGNVDNTTGADGAGTLTIGATGGALTVVSGTIGATNSLKAVNVDSTGGLATFGGAVEAATITTAGTGGTTFSGAVTATTVSLGDTGTQTFSDDATVTTMNFTADGTAVMAADKKIVGAVTTSTTNTGTLTQTVSTDNLTLVSGNVGTSTNKLKAVNLFSASGKNTTMGGEVNATTITVDGADDTGIFTFSDDVNATTLALTANSGVLNFADGADLTADVTTATNGDGTLTFAGDSVVTGDLAATANRLAAVNVNGGIVSVNDDLYATTTTVATGGTLKFAGTTNTVGGNITTAGGTGTVDLGTSQVTQTGDFTLATGSTLGVTIGSTNGKLTVTGTTSVDAAAKVDATVAGTITSGTAIDIIVDDDAAIVVPTVVDNSARYDFALAQDGFKLTLTPTVETAASLNLSAQSTGAYGQIDAAFASDSEMLTAINIISTNTALDAAIKTLTPDVSGGASLGSAQTMRSSLGTIEARLANLYDASSNETGFSSGDNSLLSAFWLQGFGSNADQSERNAIAGYDATTWGVIAGWDNQLDDHPVNLGFAFSYANTDIDNDGSANETDIDSYQGTLYGSYEAANFFLDGSLAYARNNYDGKRHVVVGAVNRIARSDYDGDQYSAKVAIGKRVGFENDVTMIPRASLQYTNLSLDGYTETGAGTANLIVEGDDIDALYFGLNTEFNRKISVESGKVIPNIHLGLTYDAIGDDLSTTSTFAGGGTSFVTNGADVERFGYNIGLGITFVSDNDFELAAAYDYEGKQDYSNHSGLVRATWKF